VPEASFGAVALLRVEFDKYDQYQLPEIEVVTIPFLDVDILTTLATQYIDQWLGSLNRDPLQAGGFDIEYVQTDAKPEKP